jgi:hypothetical protein
MSLDDRRDLAEILERGVRETEGERDVKQIE